MSESGSSPSLAGIRLHPIKSLDPVSVAEARIGPNGGLELDRAWALYSVDGQWINAKRTAAVHLIRATYASDLTSVTLSVPDDRRNIAPITLAFPGDTELAEWFSAYFEQPVIVRHARDGFPDDGLATGPTIISTASLEAVCNWFPGMTLDEARQRFRTTLEIDVDPDPNLGAAHKKLPAFWEDQLFGPNANYAVRFRIGEVAFEGSNPCARCPVPSRDTHTGVDTVGFQKRFSDLRRAQLPPWSPAERFDHFYRLAINTRVPSSESGKLLRLKDELRLV